MVPLLFLVLFTEGVVALLLLVKIGPLRELVMRSLDQLKIGKGPATVKTLACTLSLILASSVMSILKIQNRGAKIGTLTPMDQVLWRTHLLEASLMGYTLFLGFVVDRLHHYLRKLFHLRKVYGASKQEFEKLKKENQYLKEKEEKASKDARLFQERVSSLTESLQKMRSELEEKEKRATDAEAHVSQLQKQAEDLLLEYDRLFENNQSLQGQLNGFC